MLVAIVNAILDEKSVKGIKMNQFHKGQFKYYVIKRAGRVG